MKGEIFALSKSWVLLKCEIRLISRNQIDFAKSDLTEMRNQSKLYNYPLNLLYLPIIIKNSILKPKKFNFSFKK